MPDTTMSHYAVQDRPDTDTRLSHLRHAYARLHQSEDMRLGWLRDIAIDEAVTDLRAAGLDGLAERAWDEPLAVMVEVGRLLDEAERREREQVQW